MFNSIKSRLLPVLLATLSGVALAQVTEVASLEHDTDNYGYSSFVRVVGDTYALAYRGFENDGFIKTFTIPADGSSITEVASLEHDTNYGLFNSLVRVDDDTYALAYTGFGNDGFIKTFTIPADGSFITEMASLEHDTLYGRHNSLVRVVGDTYALAYRGSPGNDGFIKTFTIPEDGSSITEVFSLEHDTEEGGHNSLVRVDDDTIVLAYASNGNDGFIKTFTIPADGSSITEESSLEHNTHTGLNNSLVRVVGDTYALAYAGPGYDGFIQTFTIPVNGSSITPVASLEHDTKEGTANSLVRVDDDTYVLAYGSNGDDGFIKTFTIPADGSFITEVTSLEHDTLYGRSNSLVRVDDDTYALAYAGPNDDGFIKTFTIAGSNTNQPTVTSAPTVTTSEDTAYAFGTSDFNYSDADGDALDHIEVTSLETAGTLYLDADDNDTYDSGEDITANQDITAADITWGHLRFVPASNANGSSYTTFQYKVNDGTYYSSSASTMAIDVTAVNDAPTATAQTITVNEDTDVAVTLAGTDVEGSTLSFKIFTLPANGTLYQTSDGSTRGDTISTVPTNVSDGSHRVIYVSATNGNGSGHGNFGFNVNDGTTDGSQATVTVNVTAVDDVPTATAQTVSADEDVDKTITLAGTEVDGQDLTYKISTLPANGTLYQTSDGSTRGDAISTVPTTVSDGSHRIIYRSAQDGHGDGHGNFGFKVNDGTTDSGESTVTVNVASVNDDIMATAQTVSADEDVDKTITLAATDVEGRTLSYQITTLPASGTLYQTSDDSTRGDAISSVPTTVSDGSHRIIYVSAANGSGDGYGNFGFKAVSGSASSSEATVTVNVTAVNDAPVATVQTVTVDEDTDVAITLSGTDIEGSTLTYKISTLPSNGTLYQTSDGSTRGDTISVVSTTVTSTEFKMIYVSALNGNGDDHGNFAFVANDGTDDSDAATVTVNVTAVNDVPAATAQTVTALEDVDRVITLSGTDIEGSALTYTITTLPSKGTLYQANSDTSQGDAISEVPTTVIHRGFKLVYVSALNGNGDGYGNFGFKINDGTDDSDAAAVTVNVSPVDDPPTVANGIAEVAADEAADETQNKTFIDLSNVFTDLDNEDSDITKSVQANTNETLVTASVSADILTLEYVVEEYGSTTITVRGTSNSLWVEDEFNVLVNRIDYELTAAPQTVTVDEDVDVTITLQGADEDGRELIFQVTALPLNGTLYQTDDGTTRGDPMTSSPSIVTSVNQQVIYAADPHQYGEGHGNFFYRVRTDDGSKSREEDITVDVISVNDPPLDITLTPNSVEDGLEAEAYVGKLTTSDADTSDTHVYRFVSGDGDEDEANDNFRIEGDSLFTLVLMDYPSKPTHAVLIRSTDPQEVFYEEAMTIVLIGAGMTIPHVTPDQVFTLSEYTASGTEVGYLEGTDIDIDDILQDWTIISGDDKGHFILNDTTGIITTAAIVNFEDISSYTLGITVSDNIFTSPVEDILIEITDVDEGITVNRTTGLVTSEYGESDTFTVVLASAPLEDVIIPVFSSDVSEASVSPDSLIFTPSGWSEPMTVRVTGINDFFHDGNIAYTIITASSISSDPNYSGIDLPDVAATNMAKDIQGPVVTFLPLDPGYGSVNTPLTINAMITDINNIKNPVLIYAAGGNTKTGVIFMDSTGVDKYQATIPGDAMTFMGISYYISTSDNQNNTTTSDIRSAEVKFLEESLSSDIAGSVLKEGLPRNKWRMISVPARLDEDDVLTVLDYSLGDKKSTTWDVRQWNGEDWQEPAALKVGNAYWLIHGVKAKFPFTTGSGYSVDQSEYKYELQPGWNMIGNPYPFTVNLNIQESNIYGPITYGWSGEGWSSPEMQLLPWAGYAIYNRWVVPATLVLKPIEAPTQITRKIVAEPDGWKLNIGAYGDTYIDPGNAVGRLSGSLEELDFRDNPEPPYMDGYVSVVMPRKEWNTNISHFTSDIRSLAEPEGVWDIQLRVKEETSPVSLSFSMEGDFPSEHDIVLLDLIKRETHHLKEISSLTINQNWDKFPIYPFKVIAGSPEYVSSMTQEILSQLPESFTLHQNYPNPFNPTTTIRFEVPIPSQVTLKIYNLMGQEVTTLTRDWFSVGSHSVTWNGKDLQGVPVSAGVYIYRLQAQGFQETRKMVLLK